MIATMCSTSVTLVTNPPSRQVLTAFGVTAAEPRAVYGGQGTTWRAGKVVMKPTGNPAEAVNSKGKGIGALLTTSYLF